MHESEYLTGRHDMLEKFSEFPFLKNIDSDQLLNMLTLSKLRSYDEGEVVTPEGAYDSYIYVLVYGEVKVTREGKALARFCDSGDIFGELAIIDGEARSATITCTIKTLCLAIDASFLDRLSEEDQPAFYSVFYRMLAEILSQRLREADLQLVHYQQEIEALKARINQEGELRPH